jgi:UDP-N-acetylmuramoylalanine--D-glutamate ligase
VVLELANFQLYKFPYSPHIAVCLMITEEHLDWHTDIEEYIEAKANLFEHQKPDDIAIYFANNEYSKSIAEYSPGKKVPYYQPPGAYIREDGMIILGQTEIITKNNVRLLGEHNLENICAALTTVFEATGNFVGANEVLSSFSGLEHRLEFVREFEGTAYYDDSFATTPEAALVAIKAFREPKIIILGGYDKGLDFAPLVDELVKNNVKHVVVIGQTADHISMLLKAHGFNHVTNGLNTMAEVVAAARESAQPGDVILLSTGTSSFGMFKDYKERGDLFKQAVQQLV